MAVDAFSHAIFASAKWRWPPPLHPRPQYSVAIPPHRRLAPKPNHRGLDNFGVLKGKNHGWMQKKRAKLGKRRMKIDENWPRRNSFGQLEGMDLLWSMKNYSAFVLAKMNEKWIRRGKKREQLISKREYGKVIFIQKLI